MARLVCLVGKTDTGKFIDPVTGKELRCVTEGVGLDVLLKVRDSLRTSGGVLGTGKGEIKLTDIRLLANHTAGGELKTPLRFR